MYRGHTIKHGKWGSACGTDTARKGLVSRELFSYIAGCRNSLGLAEGAYVLRPI